MSPTLMDLRCVPYITARECIYSADVLLFRSKRNVSLIAKAGRSDYNHAGLAAWWCSEKGTMGFKPEPAFSRLICLDTVAFRGGGHTFLSDLVEESPGCIDVYQPTIDVDIPAIVEKMMETTSGRYGWWGLLKVSTLHLPVFRLFAKPNLDDESDGSLPFCSDAVSRAYRLGGGIDLVPNLADKCTEPGDLARSALLSYKFTLI